MLYRLRTAGFPGRKNYIMVGHGIKEGWEITVPPTFLLSDYERRFEKIASPEDGCTVFELKEEVSDIFFQPFVTPGIKPKKSEVFDPDRITDRQHGEFPIITGAYKKMIEEIDPGVHQFIPVKLWWNEEIGEIPEIELYFFVCGRIVSLEVEGTPPLTIPEQDKYVILSRDEKVLIPALLARPSLYEKLAEYPLWSFWSQRESNYISQSFLDTVKARGLHGFEVATKRQKPRDIQHVR